MIRVDHPGWALCIEWAQSPRGLRERNGKVLPKCAYAQLELSREVWMDLYSLTGNAQHRYGGVMSASALEAALSICAEIHAQQHMPLARRGVPVEAADRGFALPRTRDRAITVERNAGHVRLAPGRLAGSTGPRRCVVAFVGAAL